MRCFVELFPNDPRTKTAHLATKEYIVRSYLNEEFSNVFIHNKRLILSDKDKLCTSHDRRIDFQTEVKDYIVAVEVDENQHKGYNLIDEEIRIMQIYEDADKKLVFIRFNPDNYRENGILRKTTWNIRLEALKIKINEIIDNINIGDGYNEWYTEIKMFFDTGEVKTKRSTTSKGLYTTDITKICSGITSRKKPCKIRGKFEDGFCRHHKPS
uniref:Endonuclease n=1 Tax=Pithovirus LCPAC401 TaxID=2506595 RepID=A0A481ZBF0_9VIRU|nr:MAG: endonuclease [Pithovirus LCPAC401]